MKLKQLVSFPVILNLLKKVLKLYGIFAAANLCVKIYQFVYHTTRARQLWKHVPGDRLDKIGFRIAANAERFHDYYAEQALRHPTAPLVKGAGPGAEMICNTAESIEWLLRDEFPNVTKMDGGEDYLFHLMREFIGGDGIFVLRHGELLQEENDKWLKERKVASRIFTKANFDSFMYDTFVAKSKLAVQKLNSFAEKGEVIDMQELFFSFTMDSIEKFFFGTEVDTISGSMSEYAKSFDKAHVSMMNILISTIPIQLANRLLFPYPFGKWGNDSDESRTLSLRLFGMLSKNRKEFDIAVEHLDSHVYKYIEQTRKDPKLSSRNDIIANFLNSKIGNELSDKMLRDIILNLTIAGRDTTACTLSWLFFELSQNLDVQRKLAAEIEEKLKGRMPTLDDFEPSKLPYLNGVLYEALRLHPPVPTNVKTPTKDIQYRDGTIIPRGTKLMYLPYAMGRNPVTYPDPLRFLPERWIPFKQPTLYEFPVFQAGPRFCLGKDMAMFEAKLLTAVLIQNFEFRLLEGEADKIWYSLMLTMSIVNGKDRLTNNLWMCPRKR